MTRHSVLIAMVASLAAGFSSASPLGYVIQSGDTLWSLAGQCFGVPERWPELWRLNPQIENPDTIWTESRLTMPDDCPALASSPSMPAEEPTAEAESVDPPTIERGPFAIVKWTHNRVEEQQPPQPWTRTHSDRELDIGHAIRTFTRASTSLAFFDLADITLSEDSLVFLRDREIRARRSYGKIEIIEGAIDLLASARTDGASAGVVIAARSALVESDSESSTSHLRSRLTDDGDLQLMVFEGSSRVTGAAQSVALESGTGTIVPLDGPPGTPQPLIAAPVVPEGKVTANAGQPSTLVWTAVTDAAAYRVLVCLDHRCTNRVVQAQVADASFPLPELAVGSYFWQVAAIAASGLDGMPSTPGSLEVREAQVVPPAPESPSLPWWILILIALVLLVVIIWWLRSR